MADEMKLKTLKMEYEILEKKLLTCYDDDEIKKNKKLKEAA